MVTIHERHSGIPYLGVVVDCFYIYSTRFRFLTIFLVFYFCLLLLLREGGGEVSFGCLSSCCCFVVACAHSGYNF
jgi:hypothetical protein